MVCLQKLKYLCWLYLLFTISISHAETFKQHILDNGLKVIIKEDSKYPGVLLQVWYKVGSSYERNSQLGASYLIEKMGDFGGNDPQVEYLKKLFFEHGGKYSSHTDLDFTVYNRITPIAGLEVALKLESNRMHSLLFNEQFFNKLKKDLIIQRTLEDAFITKWLGTEQFYKNIGFSARNNLSNNDWINSIEDLTINKVHKWYTDWYIPNNAILIIAGNIKLQDVYNLVEQYFGPIPTKSISSNAVKQLAVMPLKYNKLEVSLPIKIRRLFMEYQVPSLNTAKYSWEPYAIEIFMHILSDSNNCRFAKNIIRNQDPIAIDIKGTYNLFLKEEANATFLAVPRKDKHLMELEEAINQQIELLKTTLISEEELKNVKSKILATSIYEDESILEKMKQIGRLEIAGYNFGLIEHRLKEIKNITSKQVQIVAKKYFIKNALKVIYLTPEGEG